MDYATFVSKISEWTENDNDVFMSNIPMFISNACKAIGREVDAVDLNTTTSIVCSSGNPIVPLPTTCDVIKTLVKTSAGKREFVPFRSYDECLMYWPHTGTQGGSPVYYNRINRDELYVVPTPTTTQELELRYVGVTIPSSVNTSTYLLSNYPNLLLYRTLVDANLFLMDMENAQMYQAYYDRERQAVENEARRNRRDDTSTINKINTTVHENNLKGEGP